MEMESEPNRRERRGESSRGGGEQMVSVGTIEMGALDCTVCFQPLTHRVFQCVIGHVICSSCHGKLVNKDKCHVCSITGGYSRCIAIEQILESVRAPCSNSMYGCTVKTHYFERGVHEKSCPYEPCICPEDGCDFAGSTPVLLHHLTGEHSWPSTEFEYNRRFHLQILEGMHVLHSKENGSLFLVRFTTVPPVGSAASIFCVDPHPVAGEPKFGCRVSFHRDAMPWKQSAHFHIKSTNLSNGLPEDGSYSVVVPTLHSNLPSSRVSVRISKLSGGEDEGDGALCHTC